MSAHSYGEGYTKALEIIDRCSTEQGFLAADMDIDNYRRVWARDGVIVGLAALLTGEESHRKTFYETLATLRYHQGPHGEIPNNVDNVEGPCYGGMVGRVDSDLWFIIGCASYWRATKDEQFLKDFLPAIEKVQFLLGCWEFNNRGFIYVPQAGDWADEYIQHGYVLYDQLLYWRALHDMHEMFSAVGKNDGDSLIEKADYMKHLIRDNYWFVSCDLDPLYAYHPTLHKKGCEAATHRNVHWMSFFSPTGYGYRFDSMANVLVSLFDIADNEQRKLVDGYINNDAVHYKMKILPAFYPVIKPEEDAWNSLQVSFSYRFKNNPYEFHNGGLWQFVTGFYVVDLMKRGEEKMAREYLDHIEKANKLDINGGEWGFFEFIHGRDLTPGGTRHQAWSAAATLMGHHALEGKFVL